MSCNSLFSPTRHAARLIVIHVLSFTGIWAIPEARINSVTHAEISTDGYKTTVLSWHTQNQLRYQLHINRQCESPAGGLQVAQGTHEIIVNAVDLSPGKNEIRLCLEERGEKSELVQVIYREDSVPTTHALPEPVDWNGDDPILLHCNNCASMHYSLGIEKQYAGPIQIPAEGATVTFFAISPAGVRSGARTLAYDRKESAKPWHSGRLQLAPLFLATMGGLRDVLPSGWGGTLSYEQGPDFFLSTGRAWYLPGVKGELGMLYFAKQASREILVPMNAGPIWEVAPFDRHNGRFFFSGLIGLTYISARAGDFARSVVTGDLQLIGGYRLPWENFALRLAGRYSLFFDKSVSLNGFGGEIGIEYTLF